MTLQNIAQLGRQWSLPLLVVALLTACGSGDNGTTIVPIPTGEAAPLSAQKNAFTEAEFSANPALKVQMGHVVVANLEPVGAKAASGDSGNAGIDAFPVQIKTAATYTFNLQIDKRHYMRIIDVANKEVTKIPGGSVASVPLVAGDYLLEFHSGANSTEAPNRLYIQLGAPKSSTALKLAAPVATTTATTTTTSTDPGANLTILVNTSSCKGCNLRGIQYSGQNLNGDSLAGADLTGAQLINTALVGVDFTGAILDGANLSYSFLSAAKFDSASVKNANFNVASASNGDISAIKTDFSGSDLRNALLWGPFDGAKFRNAKLGCITANDVDNYGNQTCGFYRGSMKGVDLTGATITTFQWSWSSWVFTGTDFTGATWTDGALCMKGSLQNCVKFVVGQCTAGVQSAIYCQQTGGLVAQGATGTSPYRYADLANLSLGLAFLTGNDMLGVTLRGADLHGALLGCPYNNDPVFNTLSNDPYYATAPAGCLIGSSPTISFITDMTGADLGGANLAGANLNMVRVSGVNFAGANLAGAYLSNNMVPDPNGLYVSARGQMDLTSANLNNANLTGAIMAGDTFLQATLNGANLSGANLVGVNMSGLGDDLTQLSANLTSAILKGANLSGASLRGTQFGGADLTGANFTGADLSGKISTSVFGGGGFLAGKAYLGPISSGTVTSSGAILVNANLTNANFTNANLTAVNLYGAKISGVIWTGANLSGATWIDGTKCSIPAPPGACQ